VGTTPAGPQSDDTEDTWDRLSELNRVIIARASLSSAASSAGPSSERPSGPPTGLALAAEIDRARREFSTFASVAGRLKATLGRGGAVSDQQIVDAFDKAGAWVAYLGPGGPLCRGFRASTASDVYTEALARIGQLQRLAQQWDDYFKPLRGERPVQQGLARDEEECLQLVAQAEQVFRQRQVSFTLNSGQLSSRQVQDFLQRLNAFYATVLGWRAAATGPSCSRRLEELVRQIEQLQGTAGLVFKNRNAFEAFDVSQLEQHIRGARPSTPEWLYMRTKSMSCGWCGQDFHDLPQPVGICPRCGRTQGATERLRVPEARAELSDQPGQRFFLAELEDHPLGQALKKEEQYAIAFSVGPSSADSFAESLFPDETLAAADVDIDVFDLTVQLDSDDFEILGSSTRPLRVPRSGRSLGKARFDIAPRRNGPCRLVASVHYRGNFVHQMKLTIPVGGRRLARVDVSTRGRPPDSAAALEPRDISILLEPAPAGGFLCTALGSVGGRALLPITATELAAAVDSARQAMMTVIQSTDAGKKVFQDRIDIPVRASDAALETLARAGSRLFQQLFLHPAAGQDARAVGEWLRGYAMKPGVRLTVQIFADHAPLPWAMLYLGDASAGGKLSWDNFLGVRHIVEQLPLQMSLRTTDNAIPSKPKLAVSINVNTSIDRSTGLPLVAGHQQHWRETAATRTRLSLVARVTKGEVVQALANQVNGDQILYFYCHATAGAYPDAAAIIMADDGEMTVADLNLDAPTTVQLAGNPLVFINACESAELSPLFYNGFVPYFMAKGARGVIGTECKTPALFAIEWADAFFDQFLDGAAVGETVLKLRQDFLANHHNPLGLIYAVHCDADTRVAPALARSGAMKQ
jgi:hypothetical protein